MFNKTPNKMKNTTHYNGFNLLEKNIKGWVIEEAIDHYGNHYYLYMVSGMDMDTYRFYCVNEEGETINKESHLIKEEAKFSFDENLKAANRGFTERFKFCSTDHLNRLFSDSKCDIEKQVIIEQINKNLTQFGLETTVK